ncbi:alpha/beta hydrolase [Plectosphaerella plurivora]|uniref:Alpha/beta hydrolase n=1 Tax=Plectosphaerella plurivora TaxID=936078 RepID=A0A9P8V192_9PEZI|nr:alpha/beta hydrolase [Plectosphaerella plurivora]
MRFHVSEALLVAASIWTAVSSTHTIGTIINRPSLPNDYNGSNFTYNYPISLFRFASQGQDVEMAFIDVPPRAGHKASRHKGKPITNPPVALLLHGKNFCSITWRTTIATLSKAGYRVIAPDQIGFCKSTKPRPGYQFSLAQLALNTNALLETLGVLPDGTPQLAVIGHSLGGMLATRFALQHPSAVAHGRLVLVNPIGLEDYIAEGVPYTSIDVNLAQEATQDYGSIRAYQEQVYYPGTPWRSEFDVWVRMSAKIYAGSEREAFLQAQARVVDVVLSQPVAHEFERLKVARTLVMIGEDDTTAVGKAGAPPEVQARLGRFAVLGPTVAARIPGAEYAGFPGRGHAPQIEVPGDFHKRLLSWLKAS